MGPKEFIWKYLAGPVIADAKNAETAVWEGVTPHTGYNPVNTVTWAVLAAVLGYGALRGMKRYDVEFNVQTSYTRSPSYFSAECSGSSRTRANSPS